MKLAEALILRADSQKRIQQLRERLVRCARVQEGDTPPENPEELLAELRRVVDQLTDLVKRINRTNTATAIDSGMSLTDALAERDSLSLEVGVLSSLIGAATSGQHGPFASAIKTQRAVNVAQIQKRVDDLSRKHRELDARIQGTNWLVDLSE